jgi:hypothetical protein
VLASGVWLRAKRAKSNGLGRFVLVVFDGSAEIMDATTRVDNLSRSYIGLGFDSQRLHSAPTRALTVAYKAATMLLEARYAED